MPLPPFVTCLTTFSSFGRSSSRFGPTLPLAFAARIVWQSLQPASAKTLAPGEPPPSPLALELPPSPPPPPQPAERSRIATRAIANGAIRRIRRH
jgi:hypothetical protein